MRYLIALTPTLLLMSALVASADEPPARLSLIEVAKDNSGFVLKDSGKKFVPWGFN